MEQYIFQLALMRAIERIIALLLGGLFMYLGYRMFLKVPHPTDSTAEVDIPGRLKVILTRIGPSIFFAGFGALIVWSSYRYGVTMSEETRPAAFIRDTTQRDTTSQIISRSTIYSGANGRMGIDLAVAGSRQAEVRRAMRTLTQWPAGKSLTERAALEPTLLTIRLALVRSVWQPAWGDYEQFRGWISNGAQEAEEVPAFRQPYSLYKTNE
jgi:hypothetical protein